VKSLEAEFIAVEEGLGGQILRFEIEAVEALGWKGKKRVLLELPTGGTMHRALRPSKNGYYFIGIDKKTAKKQGWEDGMRFPLKLELDHSEYQMDTPEEFREVMAQDPEGKALFESQTPGRQRSMLHYISSAKSSQLRIERTFLFIERMKENGKPFREN